MKGKKHHSAGQIIRQLEEAVECRANSRPSLPSIGGRGIHMPPLAQSVWRRMKAEEAKRLKEREKENSRLKQMVADLLLDKALLTDIARGNF